MRMSTYSWQPKNYQRMNNNTLNKTSGWLLLFKPVLLIAIVVLAVCSIWQLSSLIEKDLRKDLLVQAQLVVSAINVERIKTLTGTKADLNTPDYLRRKEMLASVRTANPKCRFAYLVGQRPDGKVFFFADSEPAGSETESPPGQIYEEIPEEFLKVFATEEGSVEGPSPDRWGTWVTALAPLKDPKTGELVAVFCMDFDARSWRWEVASRTSLPASLILMVLALIYVMQLLRERTKIIKQNEQKYQYLFEDAAGGIAILRGDKIEFANPALARIVGHPANTLFTEPFITLVHPEDKKMVQERYDLRLMGHEVETGYDFRVIAFDGTVKWVNINSQLIQWEGDVAILSFITDITDRKRTEEKLAVLYEETNLVNRLMRDRENRMLELKKEVNKLSQQLNQGIVYKSVED